MYIKLLFTWLTAASATTIEDLLEQDKERKLIAKCDSTIFNPPSLGPDVKILSVKAETQRNFTTPGRTNGLPSVAGLDFCSVKVHLNHQGSDDDVLVEVWLPASRDAWNGRFQATGGGGMATGVLGRALGPAVRDGYSASSADGGHDGGDHGDLSWALNTDGTINWGLLHNFATRSLVEQIVVGKSITEQFFQEKPRYSYWNGCSQGGRQGYVIAQQYPHLLDGILANAPAISLTHLAMAEFWPQLVMKEEGVWMSSCEFDYFRQKEMDSCDMLDGVHDGVIADPDICDFDPLHLIDQVFDCDSEKVKVTRAMANIIRKIRDGPRTPLNTPIWHGLAPGTNFNRLASTSISTTGLRSSNPFPISSNFIQNLVLQQLSFNVTSLTYASYTSLWAQASAQYSWLLDADNPNLALLQKSGAKLLTWHGTSDPLIPHQSTVQYRTRVEQLMGGAGLVDDFYRVFLAPGVEHCARGNGAVPRDPLAALVEWVEEGIPPETLEAATGTYEGELVTRELCAWPGKAKYLGIGDAKRASSWTCVGGTERPGGEEGEEEEEGGGGGDRVGRILGGLKERLEGLGLGLTVG